MKPLYYAHDLREFQDLNTGIEKLLQNYQLMGLPEVADVHVRSSGNIIEITPDPIYKISSVGRVPLIRKDQKHEGDIIEAYQDRVKIIIGDRTYNINYTSKQK